MSELHKKLENHLLKQYDHPDIGCTDHATSPHLKNLSGSH
jgi:hypothetical protein